MTEQPINPIVQRAWSFSRRGSLAALSAVGLATLAGPSIAEAKKPCRKAKRRARKNGREKCKKQVDQCTAVFEDLCAESGDAEDCLVRFIPCCPFFGGCQIDQFINCAFELVSA